jgi:acyl carrier protein
MDRKDIETRLSLYIRRELLHRPDYPLTPDEPLITGGLIDSHSLVRIAVFAEDELGVMVPDTEFTVEKMDTLRLMVDRIMAEAGRNR